MIANLLSPRSIGLGLIAGGSLLLAWVGYTLYGPQTQALPYKRVLVGEGAPKTFPEIDLGDNTGLHIRKYEIRTEGIDRPLAEFHVAQASDEAPVPLSWQSHLAEPVLLSDAEAAPAKKVAEVIRKHLPEDAIVFAWWDTSRRLKLYNDIPVAFDGAGPGPIFVPGVWRDYEGTIREEERVFWKPDAVSPSQQEAFGRFGDALLMDVNAGMAKLREMANGRPVYIALNVVDAFKAGHASPDKFGIGFKDFAKTSQSHGLIKGVKAWIKENGHTAYSVYSLDETVTRVFFLTDEQSKGALLASLLPFDSSKPGQVPGTKLVYQHRGYWIYKLTDTAPVTN